MSDWLERAREVRELEPHVRQAYENTIWQRDSLYAIPDDVPDLNASVVRSLENSRNVLEKINLDRIRMKGYGFQIEMKFTTWKYGFKVEEVPIIFTDRREGSSKMSGGIFSEALWGVIRMKFKSYFRKYE